MSHFFFLLMCTDTCNSHGEAQSIVNQRIDLQRFNEIILIILYYWIVYKIHTAKLKPDA